MDLDIFRYGQFTPLDSKVTSLAQYYKIPRAVVHTVIVDMVYSQLVVPLVMGYTKLTIRHNVPDRPREFSPAFRVAGLESAPFHLLGGPGVGDMSLEKQGGFNKNHRDPEIYFFLFWRGT